MDEAKEKCAQEASKPHNAPKWVLMIDYKNGRGIVRNPGHIVRNDPRRGFTFGITIENTSLKLWLSCCAVTKAFGSFDFRKLRFLVATTPVRLVACLAFTDQTALRWDPSIRPSYAILLKDTVEVI
ncbi:hypothetical protein FRB96_003275 [Tulasnella sp. 330]|nr:hypothetical protein FRB96_003275 [Tulasnella sp. 330]